ncbi:tetratricopeptide repeat protein [Deinococcus koreensis]|uniref:Uncharacterized protein n=1 Tax=Deinococcus koreensis TaxID=2054903 RepID=A0A2K3UXK5_9DEIO|nr:tetratricopeptide repeat protein [Deinococcus koreensis]PNY81273.1 hypothetical protein CVO96_07620 [Deinococcus koreensis]
MTLPAELSDDLHAEVTRLCAEGDDLAEAEQFDAALATYQQALDLLPEPVDHWDATFWLYTAIGDAHFLRGSYEDAWQSFNRAQLIGPLDNAFIHLRIGQCAFELSDMRRAGNGLMGAYALAGPEIFDGEDPKYLSYLSTIALDIDTSALPPSA